MNILNHVMTFAEATEMLGKSPSYLNNLVATGRLVEGPDFRTAGRVKLIKFSVVEKIKKGEFKMRKIEVSNCHTLEVSPVELKNITYFEGKDIGFDVVELSNGIALRNMGDGRYFDENLNKWAAIHINEYDEDGEIIQGELVGYTEV